MSTFTNNNASNTAVKLTSAPVTVSPLSNERAAELLDLFDSTDYREWFRKGRDSYQPDKSMRFEYARQVGQSDSETDRFSDLGFKAFSMGWTVARVLAEKGSVQ